MSVRLAALIRERREELADRWVAALRDESASSALPHSDLRNSICAFLDDMATSVEAAAGLELENASARARLHGEQRFRLGYNIDGLIREYGTLREVLYQLMEAEEFDADAEEARALSRVLVEGIASAAAQYSVERDAQARTQTAQHVGFLAHELRNPLQSAQLRIELAERRPGGATPEDIQALKRALRLLRERIDNELYDVRLRTLPEPILCSLELRSLLESVTEDVAQQAALNDVAVLLVADDSIPLVADERLLDSAVSNLIRNAVKFSKPGTKVHVRAKVANERVVLEVEDGCGGLPEGAVEKLFDPFVQMGQDRSGFGLGLAIAKQAAELHGGGVRVHDLPGRGCVFILDLPQTATTRISD